MKIWKDNKESIIIWVQNSLKRPWAIKMYELIDKIIDETEAV